MIANPSKFQAIVLSKSKENIQTYFHIKDKVIKSQEEVQLLGITLDYKLDFSKHIGQLCQRASGQLNALFRFEKYLSTDSKQLAVTSFIASNFNYCPLIWHFTSYESETKLDRLQNRYLRFLSDNSEQKYTDLKMVTVSMKVKRLRVLATEIFKTLHNLNPKYMQTIFKKSNNRRSERLKYNIEVAKYNQSTYGKNSLRVLGPMLWNSLPSEAKMINSLPHFKAFIKEWGTQNCPHYRRFLNYTSAI